MNVNFKPLGLVAAVAAATAGYTGVVNAQAALAGNSSLGDMALVPYYTVNDGYATGVSIINTSDRTQVIKLRLRRASDSMDALDFSVVLSPEDVYTGVVAARGADIVFVSNDNSCTAPAMPSGGFVMPSIFRTGAEEGYIEVISMGSPVDEVQPIATAALHGADGVPANCAGVRDNFFAGGVSATTRGVVDSVTTVQNVAGVATDNTYDASPDSLKVSYFIKSDATGAEFGNNAVHFAGFMDGASMTNQQTGIASGDLQGFDYPDLNGGGVQSVLDGVGGAASRGLYEDVRAAIGVTSAINDWSANQSDLFSVDTDWVITTPGQYIMMDSVAYQQSLVNPAAPCLPNVCDFRDIPLTASFSVWDREEQSFVIDPGDLVVSPQPVVVNPVTTLPFEVNVVQWGNSPVLNANASIAVDVPDGAETGWADLSVTPDATKTQQVCDYTAPATVTCVPVVNVPAPIVGFVAWQRSFAGALASANYGRIVEHSYRIAP